MNRQTRQSHCNRKQVQLRMEGDGETKNPVISGYGAVFYREDEPGTEYHLWGEYYERIMPGAFDDVDFSDVRSMFNHNPNMILGRSGAGTLRTRIDSTGLHYEVQLDPNSQQHNDVRCSVDRGDVEGSSFWFMIEDEVTRKIGDKTVFEITKIRNVTELGPVTMPAYIATTAEARSAHIESRKAQIESEVIKVEKQRGIDELRMRTGLLLVNQGIVTNWPPTT